MSDFEEDLIQTYGDRPVVELAAMLHRGKKRSGLSDKTFRELLDESRVVGNSYESVAEEVANVSD